jgi:hypothetical protein
LVWFIHFNHPASINDDLKKMISHFLWKEKRNSLPFALQQETQEIKKKKKKRAKRETPNALQQETQE